MLQHKHLLVRAEVNQPPRCPEEINIWLLNLIKALKMNVMMGPFAKYCFMEGNRGLTAAAIIETSHVIMHSWDEESPGVVQLDVYTCSDLDPEIIWAAITEFEPTHVDYKLLDRESKFITVLEKSS